MTENETNNKNELIGENESVNENEPVNENELKIVTGGSHLSSGEVKTLVPGTILIWENAFGKNLAEVEFISYEDPGTFSLLQCTVKIISIFAECKYIEVFDMNELGQCVGHKLHEGDVYKLSRDLLDFPEDA